MAERVTSYLDDRTFDLLDVRGDEQPKREASALRYPDEMMSLIEDLTRIVDRDVLTTAKRLRSLVTS